MYIIKKIMCKTLILILMIIILPLIMSDQAYAGSANVVQGKAAACKYVEYTDVYNNIFDISYMIPYGPSRAVDGSTAALSRWQTRKGVDGSYLQVNLGGLYSIDRWVVYNQSYAWDNNPMYAIKGYKLQKSNDGVTFTDIDAVTGNTSSMTDRTVTRFTASYLRVQVTEGCLDENHNSWDSIQEFQAFGDLVALPSVSTPSASAISGNSAALSGTVVSDGGADIAERGFVYSLNDNPVINGSGVYSASVSGTTGDFSKTITTGIVKNTKYYYRAYAKNIKGITYTEVQNFTTSDWRADISAPDPLSEDSLNSNEIILNLTGDTLKDIMLDAANFTLVNAPTGLTVGSVNYNNDTQCTISLAFDGTDFDSDINNLTLTIKGAELAGGIDLHAANNLFIRANQEPTDISLSSVTIDENNSVGTTVGTFSSVDLDAGETFTYSLVAGQGDADNGDFTIQGDNLLTGQEFDYETQNSFSIRVKTTDSLGGIYEKNFTIHITDVNETVNVTGISIKTQPTMTYNVGDSLNLGNLEVTLHKNNGTTENVVFADFTAKGITVSKTNGTVLTLSDSGTSITVTHTESGRTAQTSDLTVSPIVAPLMINTSNPLTPAVSGLPLEYTFTATGGTGTKTFAVTTGILPEGLMLAANGDLSGSPTTPGNSTFTVTVTDSAVPAATSSHVFTLTVIPGPMESVINISVKTQPKVIYTEGEALELNNLAITLHKMNASTEDVMFADFTAKGITVSKADGTVLSLADSGTAITVTYTASGQTVQTSNLTVNALPVKNYTVIFEDWDGSLIDTQIVNEGSGATAPADPSRTGYIFTSWDKTYSNITRDLTVTAQYIEDIPAVTDADKVSQDKAVLKIGFASGDHESSVTKDVTLITTGTINGSTISWNSANPSVINPNGTVTRPRFSAGDAEVSVTATISYNGASEIREFLLTVLKHEAVRYTVTFKDWDGSILNSQTVNDGSGAIAPNDPIRTGYTFTGWDEAFAIVTSNLTVTAKYSQNSSSGGGGDNSRSPEPSVQLKAEKPTIENRVITTTATVDNSGKATSTVTQAQVTEAISKGIEAAKQGSGTMSVVEIKVEAAADVKTVELSIPATAVNAVTDNGSAELTVSTPIASIAFDEKALDTISQAASGDVKISASIVNSTTLNQETQQVVGDRPVYNFSVTSGNNNISQFGGNVTVSVPYTPKVGEDINSIVIYYINAQGRTEVVSNCSYDSTTGTVRFSTNHFSQYAVGYNEVTFKDVSPNAWYSDAVSFVAARGITTGTGSGNFNPNAKLTRGQFLVMVMRSYGISADNNPQDNFSDAGNTYYTKYLAAAKKLGITSGIGNNKFVPEKEITRQEMVALLYNTLKEIGELPGGTNGEKQIAYSDASEVASWAKDAMTLFVGTGTINGSNGKLNPKGTTNRAEMAKVLCNLISEKVNE